MKNLLLSSYLLAIAVLFTTLHAFSQYSPEYTTRISSIPNSTVFKKDVPISIHFPEHSIAGSKGLDNLPFQVGFGYGSAVKLKGENYFHFGYWVFANINLYQKRFFVTTEYGGLKMNEDIDGTASYLSLGFSVIPFAFKHHSISMHLGLSYYSYNKIGMIYPTAELSYLYRFNRYLSVKGGIKLPSIQKPRENQYYHNPMVTIGLQLF